MKEFCYITDSEDAIVKLLIASFKNKQLIGHKELATKPDRVPLVVRGMTERKAIEVAIKQNRDFYYIDTGYMGNLQKRKDWHRVVKNNVQHTTPRYDLPDDRFNQASSRDRFTGWKKMDGPILLVTPSAKPCNYYNINRDQWVTDTITEIKKYTDRPIIIRDKGLRRERLGDNSVPAQLLRDNIHCLVTYNSIAATEAISMGVPAIALAPGAAGELCTDSISKIESPYFPDEDKVIAWQNWLAYCQYTTTELRTGLALGIQEDLNLC